MPRSRSDLAALPATGDKRAVSIMTGRRGRLSARAQNPWQASPAGERIRRACGAALISLLCRWFMSGSRALRFITMLSGHAHVEAVQGKATIIKRLRPLPDRRSGRNRNNITHNSTSGCSGAHNRYNQGAVPLVYPCDQLMGWVCYPGSGQQPYFTACSDAHIGSGVVLFMTCR